MYAQSMRSKTYGKGKYEGVGFPTVKKKSTEAEELRNLFFWVGYCTELGVINLQVSWIPLPLAITEEQLESHLVGVVMAQQYSTKKVKELFADKADAAVMRELNQVNNFETYLPIKAGDLSWEEKKKGLESLIFVTGERNGDIKPRNRKVAEGSK